MRKKIIISTKFTPQIAEMYDNSIEKMLDTSLERLNTNYIDVYWIHNPADVAKSVGVSNHNLAELFRQFVTDRRRLSTSN